MPNTYVRLLIRIAMFKAIFVSKFVLKFYPLLMIKKCLPLFIFLLGFNSIQSQNQYNVWYFGFSSAGLDFNAGTPTSLLNSGMGFTEGCSTYCNSNGQILFYTDGSQVWDKTHTIMPSGNLAATSGGTPNSSMQSSVIIPVYGDTNTYYLFGNAGVPTGHSTGLAFYTKINMTLNSGLGDVSTPLTTFVTGTSERMVGVKHCNGIDHWVITHLSGTNTFWAVRVTKCGVMDTVVSSIGPSDSFGDLSTPLKASPKGNKLSTVIKGITSIYDFDNATGSITGFNPIDTATSGISIANMFSPNGDLFYLSSGNFPVPVFQFDLTAPNIKSTKTTVGSSSGTMANLALPYDFQIGRDGKLYLTSADFFSSLSSLDAINNPNVLGIGCGFTNNAVTLGGRASWLNLPNNISDYLDPLPIRPYAAGIKPSSSTTCTGSPVIFTDTTDSCTPTKLWWWNFGDPASGPDNTSDTSGSVHMYNSAGTYTVTLISSDGCQRDTSTATINVQNGFSFSVSGDTSICKGTSANIVATSSVPVTYSWSPSAGLISTTGSSHSANPSTTTTYSIMASNAGGCSLTSYFTVQIDNEDVTLSGNYPLCTGDSTLLTVSGAASYTWSPSAGLSSTTGSSVYAFPTSSAPYNIYATSLKGCIDTIPFSINVVSKPVALASSGSAICFGNSVQLTAAGATNFYWSPSAGLSSTTGSSVNATPTGNTIYTVIVSYGGTCDDTTNVSITVNNAAVISVNGNTSICIGSSTTLNAIGGNSYVWSPSIGLSGTAGPSITASPTSNSNYTVTGTDGNGCTNTYAFSVNVLQIPVANAGPDQTICRGATTTLNGSGGGTYTWSSGVNTSTLNVGPTTNTVYTLTISNGSCTNTDVVNVIVNVGPTANAGPSATILSGNSAELAASGGGTYSWSPSTGLSCVTCDDPEASPAATTIYYVTVSDVNGCTSVDSLIVTVEDICIENLSIPNVFTPNGDGRNELFVLTGSDPCFKNYEIAIYNRWGNVVFQSTAPFTKFWDGTTTAGDMAADGTYYYTLIAKSESIKGFITLIR